MEKAWGGVLMTKLGSAARDGPTAAVTETLGGSARALAMPQEFVDLLPIAIYACDAEGRLLWYNARAQALWGRTPRLGEDAERIFDAVTLYHGGRRATREEYPVSRALATGEAVHGLEAALERPDGTRVWVAVYIDPVKDEHGNLIGAINCFHETTDLHAANQETQRKQDELEDFFDNCAIPLHLVAEDGTILRANDSELDMLGYSAEEYIGRSVADFHADADVIADVLERLKRGEALNNYPARLRAKDGAIRHVLITSNVRRSDREFLNTRCFSLDVTDLKHAQDRLAERERHFRELLDSLPAAIYTTDADGWISFYNRAAVELWGRAPEIGTVRWVGMQRVYRPDGTPLAPDEYPVAVALREGKPINGMEVVAERPDGTRTPILPFPTPLHDASGRIVGAVNLLVDISERKKSETQQRLLLDELNHRVKNKVQMLHALLRMAMRSSDNPEARAVLADVARRVAAIAAAQRVLYDTRQPYSFDVPELVRSVCEDAQQGFGKGMRIEIKADEGRLYNDSAMPVALILSELLTNAAKHGVSQRGEILIRVEMTKTPDSYVLSVADEGPGFELSQANAHSSGLGLVAGLARQLGGTFEVERRGGALCIVSFPRKEGRNSHKG